LYRHEQNVVPNLKYTHLHRKLSATCGVHLIMTLILTREVKLQRDEDSSHGLLGCDAV